MLEIIRNIAPIHYGFMNIKSDCISLGVCTEIVWNLKDCIPKNLIWNWRVYFPDIQSRIDSVWNKTMRKINLFNIYDFFIYLEVYNKKIIECNVSSRYDSNALFLVPPEIYWHTDKPHHLRRLLFPFYCWGESPFIIYT